MTAEDIIAAARECIDTPFRHQGRKVRVGLDCAGLALHVANRVGLCTFDVRAYSRTPANNELENALDRQPCLLRLASIEDRMPGDLLLMRFKDDPQHLAIYTGNTIIHAYESVGICCEHMLSNRWAARIVRVYQFVGPA
jgi:cell wall-associated NlpC family hydrolase